MHTVLQDVAASSSAPAPPPRLLRPGWVVWVLRPLWLWRRPPSPAPAPPAPTVLALKFHAVYGKEEEGGRATTTCSRTSTSQRVVPP